MSGSVPSQLGKLNPSVFVVGNSMSGSLPSQLGKLNPSV